MRFRNLILFTYSLLIVILVLIIGSFFYRYSSDIFEKNELSNLSVISDKISQQLDNLVYSMDFISVNLISNEKFISSLSFLSNADRNNKSNQIYIYNSKGDIKNLLTTYLIYKNFYRVSVFSKSGDYFTSNFNTNYNNSNHKIEYLPWKDKVDKRMGKILLISPYKDPWGKSENKKVFGLTRSIRGLGGVIGYIEVQNLYQELEKIFSLPDDKNVKVISITESGDIFYKSDDMEENLVNYYKNVLLDNEIQSSAEKYNSIIDSTELLVKDYSSYSGVKFLLVRNKKSLLKPINFVGNIAILIGFLVIVISFIYIYIIARHISKPIQQLTKQMQYTELVNLPDKIIYKKTNNEIESLNRSFQNLKERLNEAIKKEIKSHTLQIQANFDSLQSQVNPHFIYNILNLLSNKGVVNNDYEICEICDSIATMLRYSTSTKERTASVKEEIENIENYLSLMKKRYEHKLEFNIKLEKNIEDQIIPKITLQQIVENAINHGFKGDVLKIDIVGYKSNDWWYIEIIDNGKGFDKEKLQQFEKEIGLMSQDLFDIKSGFSINGMGLLNTYARLMLFYKNIFILKIKNLDCGVKVTIGSTFKKI